MKKQRAQRRISRRSAAQSSPSPSSPPASEPPQPTRLQAGLRSPLFRYTAFICFAGIAAISASLAIPHDYAFFEMGYFFTLSIYDLVLAMLGLSLLVGMVEKGRDILFVIAGFLVVLLPILLFFDAIFQLILKSPLGQVLFLIAPAAVLSCGLVLWLPARLRRVAAPVAAAIIGLSLSLFIGLDDFGIGIPSFTLSAVLCALWFLLVPGLMLRPFRGPWLTIPARIVGSWLVVISVIETASLYAPQGDMPPPPGVSLSDGTGNFVPLDPAVRDGLVDAPDLFGDAPLPPADDMTPPDTLPDGPDGDLAPDPGAAARSVTPPSFP